MDKEALSDQFREKEQLSLETEGVLKSVPIKRKKGRPKKINDALLALETEKVNSDEIERLDDIQYHALLAKIQGDPETFREAMNSTDREYWLEVVNAELDALAQKQVYTVIEKEGIYSQTNEPNIVSSRWVFKRKLDDSGNVKFEARLVTKGFQDRNEYDLGETYTPVSRMALIRAFLATANKFDLRLKQFDVETAFLYGDLTEETYMEIPEGYL